MEPLLAFAATLVALRLAAELVRRRRAAPEASHLTVWAAALASYALATGALAGGTAVGWNTAAFRLYYLGGALLAAALLGLGSLLLTGYRFAAPVALAYVGLAIGVAVAVPVAGPFSGTAIPAAQDHLDLFPARVLAIAANSLGTLAVVAVALRTLRRRPLGNALVVAGVAVAALGSGLTGLGASGTAVFAILAVVLLYGGFVAPSRSS